LKCQETLRQLDKAGEVYYEENTTLAKGVFRGVRRTSPPPMTIEDLFRKTPVDNDPSTLRDIRLVRTL
jgi:hypothetical protein